MNAFFCRVFQFGLKIGNYFMGYHAPKLLEGEDSVLELPKIIKAEGFCKVLVVGGPTLPKRELANPLFNELKSNDIEYILFSNAQPNPTDKNVEEGYKMYIDNNCDAVIAFGGGSPMDCAKAICARVAKPSKSVASLQGLMKVGHKVPFFCAVPTTAGTGSETTVAAVITVEATHHKASINDISLIPRWAVLDPKLTLKLPQPITAGSGMDALCHAVEAYTNHTYNTKLENQCAKEAVRLIYDNLLTAYNNGDNITARFRMQKAAFLAGRAFTRGCVGYAHAVGHGVSALYDQPHGAVMGTLLPFVMRQYGACAYKRLSELADVCNISGNNQEEKALAFINWIEKLNRQMGISSTLSMIKDNDVEQIITWAIAEANPLYPVPVIWKHDDFEKLIARVRG